MSIKTTLGSSIGKVCAIGFRSLISILFTCAVAAPVTSAEEDAAQIFRAGAFAADISPTEFPVIVNGQMLGRTADKIIDRLHARCLVLDDGTTQVAIAVVDSCMVPRHLLDEAKVKASASTGIPTSRMLISATHAHSAPSVHGCLGSDVDEGYSRFLPGQIAKGIVLAQKNLTPTKIGWAVGRDEKNVFCRRYLMKPGTARTCPFTGTKNDRAQMNPGFQNPNAIGRTSEADPDVSVVSVQTIDGRPLALLANYSTHYAGAPAISADYFGEFCRLMEKKLGAENLSPPFVGLLTNGTSGDTNCNDFNHPRRKYDRFTVAADVAAAAHEAYQRIKYYRWAPIAMEEKLLTLDVRMPPQEEVAEAKAFLAESGGGAPRSIEEVYARETVLLDEMPPTRELKLQALCIGSLGMAAIPNEVYSVTGLAIKRESPLETTFTIELANGCEGYIPPPDQHKLGGYTTWRARTSCLEVEAEPKIRAAVLEALAGVAAQRTDEKSILSEEARKSAAAEPARYPYDRAIPPEERPVAPSPVSAADSLKYFVARPGFKVELVASEPDVVDPVAFDWGPDGKLWVIEMADYPLGLDGNGKPGGRVKILEDRDGDGRYESSNLFYDGLGYPNGVMAWRGGVLVTCAPEILFLKDTTGDGLADVRETLYSGFPEGNPQLRINGLRWGLDNWIYCANGLRSEGKIASKQTGQSIDISGRDARIRPEIGAIEAAAGATQFGRNRDDWGNWFGVNNSDPLWHYVLADHYIRRNPHFAPPDSRVHVPEIPKPGPVFARSRLGTFFHESQVGRFTSANSAVIYRDELFGPEFAGNAFTSEPVHNVVHREIVESAGVTFTSHRAEDEQQSEFLASTDTWFRPTMIRPGPDGALWIADMYREIMDHPQYIPKERQAGLDFRAGDDRGRLYRVFSQDRPPRRIPRIDSIDDEQLAELLESPSGTLRDSVHQFIVSEQRRCIAPLLSNLIRGGKSAACRLHALCTLDGLDSLATADIMTALEDSHPGVRRNAIRVAEGRLNADADLGTAAARLVCDPNPQVRLQLACSLGEWNSPHAAEALGRLGIRDREEPFIVAAVLTSVHGENVAGVLQAVLDGTSGDAPPEQFVGQLLAVASSYHRSEAAAKFLIRITRPVGDSYQAWQLGAVAELASALARRGSSLTALTKTISDGDNAGLLATQLAALFDDARTTASAADAAVELRIRAIRVLGRGVDGERDDVKKLGRLLVPQVAPEVQQAAVDQLLALGGHGAPGIMLAGWRAHSPALRSQVLDALLSRDHWTAALLDAFDRGEIAIGDLDASRRGRLAAHRNKKLQARAQKLLTSAINPDRQKVLDQWQPVLELKGDAGRGALVFGKRCANCHRLDGTGHTVGADLVGVTDKSAKSLLISILDPNRAVEPRFLSYVAVTSDGRTLSGLLADENSSSITLSTPEAKQTAILRSELEELVGTGKSFMPEGLEKDLAPQDLADVIAYVAKNRVQSKAP